MCKIIGLFCCVFLCCNSWACKLPTPTPTPTPSHKVTLCHIPPGNPQNAHTIVVDQNAVKAHLAHGDYLGVCKFDCAGTLNGHAIIDDCGVCGGDNSTCKDCKGVPNGGTTLDSCGVCGGASNTCLGCDGVANSEKALDLCGICGGDNSTCKDCAGVPNGESKVDLCGVCNGNNSTCKDCAGVPNGESKVDLCGVCGGDSSSCKDCFGTPNGTAKLDKCGVCGGDGSACATCLDGPNASIGVDACGLCGGDSSSCKDCSGVPNGTAKLDKCGLCNGTDKCLDCAEVPNGGGKLDCCGVCNGDGTSCTNKCQFFDIKKLKSTIWSESKIIANGVAKYSKLDVKCDVADKKAVTKRLSTVSAILRQQKDIINNILSADKVKLCDTPFCHHESLVSEIALLKRNLRLLISLHHSSVHHSLKACCRKTGQCGGMKDSVSTVAYNKGVKATKKLPSQRCD